AAAERQVHRQRPLVVGQELIPKVPEIPAEADPVIVLRGAERADVLGKVVALAALAALGGLADVTLHDVVIVPVVAAVAPAVLVADLPPVRVPLVLAARATVPAAVVVLGEVVPVVVPIPVAETVVPIPVAGAVVAIAALVPAEIVAVAPQLFAVAADPLFIV